MKRRTATMLFIIFVIIIILLAVFIYSYYRFTIAQDKYDPVRTISIANWNLQIFGDKKANDTELMNLYAGKISKYDIIFLQEIRDKDANSFYALCSMIPDYDCKISSRAGRSSSKEQYGIVYLKKFNADMIDFNPDSYDRWERPPVRVDFFYGNYSFTAYNIHTKPDNVSTELNTLESLINSEANKNNAIVLGDLNADCNYFNPYDSYSFNAWKWVIDDDADTTSGNSACAYDRIIMNDDAYNEFIRSGIDKENIDTKVSDHYLVYVLIRDHDYKKDKTFKAYLSSII